MRHNWALYAIAFFGATAFGAAVFQVVKILLFLRASERAVGTVVRLDPARSGRNHSLVYLPIVWFQTSDKRLIEVAARTASSPPEYNVGDTVPINYLPHSPKNAKIRSFWEMWYPVVVGSIVAASALAFGLYFKS